MFLEVRFVPVKVVSVEGIEAEVEIGGVGRTISVILTPDAQVGNYVYVHTGYAISIVDETEALESLRLLRELALKGEQSVSQLVAALHVSQPLVSWHLIPLKKVGLVRVRRKGRQAYYSLDQSRLTHYHNLLASFLKEAADGE